MTDLGEFIDIESRKNHGFTLDLAWQLYKVLERSMLNTNWVNTDDLCQLQNFLREHWSPFNVDRPW